MKRSYLLLLIICLQSWLTSAQDFTIGTIADTQNLSENTGDASKISDITGWYVGQRENLNIQFVTSLGDMTQWGDWGQWERVRTAYDLFTDTGMPYAPCQGNHDPQLDRLNQFFPESEFLATDSYGGNFRGMENAYYLFSEAGMDFILVTIQSHDNHIGFYDQESITWANGILDQFSDRRAILATHDFFEERGLINDLITKHDNLFMALCGHSCAREEYWTEQSPSGNTVHMLMTDYQCDNDKGRTVRYYTFKPEENRIQAFTYNTGTGVYERDANSEFSFAYDMISVPCEDPHEAYQGNVATIPGIIEAENYNIGCSGVPYSDTDGSNNGGEYRSDAVDIQVCNEGGFNIGWTEAGEWLNYQVNVTSAGTFDFDFRVATENPSGSFHLELNGTNISGPINVASTEGWQAWAIVSANGISLPSGLQHIKIAIDKGGFNLNSFTASSVTDPDPLPTESNVLVVFDYDLTLSSHGCAQAAQFCQDVCSTYGWTDQCQGSESQNVVAEVIARGAYFGIASHADVNSCWDTKVQPMVDQQQYPAVTNSGRYNNSSTDFTYPQIDNRANWNGATSAYHLNPSQDKAEGIRRIMLHYGMDPNSATDRARVLFFDDSPDNIQNVNTELPGVIAIEVGRFGSGEAGGCGVLMSDFETAWSELSNDPDPTGLAIPGKLEAEDFSDMSGVQTEATTDVGGGMNLGWLDEGDWMDYLVDVNQAGQHTFDFRVAADGAGGSFHIELGGANISGSITVGGTTGWQVWSNISSAKVQLPAGEHTMRLVIDDGGFNMNHMTATLVDDDDERQLVWSDEFNYTGAPDPLKWNYFLGPNSANNEWQWFSDRPENVRVENGSLILEARKDFGGNPEWEYSSGRIESRNKGDWTYGRFEARAKLPGGRGTWAAIWMLPTDNVYGGWPDSGEIDIMENVGYAQNTVEGTVHTGAYNHIKNTQLGGKIDRTDYQTAFHTYAVEWTEDKMDFLMDDIVYFTHEKHGGSAEWPFDQQFHFILNLTVGGNWGAALGVDPDIWPQRMEVDYVRVYEALDGNNNPNPTVYTIPGTIEAEGYSISDGVEIGPCDEGGEAVGFIDAGDWMQYRVNVQTAGEYLVEYRVASDVGGGTINLEQNEGATLLGSVGVSNTGGWQSWATVSHRATLTAGEQNIAIGIPVGGYNLNWIRFSPVEPSTSIHIEAESYSAMEGIQTETCSEGGENIGYTDTGDWLIYNVDIPAGNYQVNYRVASQNGGGQIKLEAQGGTTTFAITDVPSTTGWQIWDTVSDQINISNDLSSIAINIPTGGYNLNWISLESIGQGARIRSDISKGENQTSNFEIYPNPSSDQFTISGLEAQSKVNIYNINSQLVYSDQSSEHELVVYVPDLKKGVYVIQVINPNGNSIRKKMIRR
ncbi:MAG: carbohydrate-binding protein [Reichenbachiella sp.]